MQGEQIIDLKGKVIGQRVLDAEGPTIETSISSKGIAKGIQINENPKARRAGANPSRPEDRKWLQADHSRYP